MDSMSLCSKTRPVLPPIVIVNISIQVRRGGSATCGNSPGIVANESCVVKRALERRSVR